MTAPARGICALVTRPREDAAGLAAELTGRGVTVMRQPMLRIEFAEGPPPDLDGRQALLFTSANGVRAFAERSDRRSLPAFAVGEATAEEARRQGFAKVASAGGDVGDLVRLVRAQCDPGHGALVHAAGSAVAGDLAGLLGDAGFAVERVQLYSAQRTMLLDESVCAALAEGSIDYALFFSPRSAASFVSLVRAAALPETCSRVRALCLSAAVADALSPLAWRGTTVAAKPTQQSLLAALDDHLMENAGNDMTTPETEDETDLLHHGSAAPIIERFGGIRPMAAKLGVPVTTVQGWKSRGQIPKNRHAAIRSSAETHAIDLTGAAAPPQAASTAEAAAPEEAPRPVDQVDNGDDGDKSVVAPAEPAAAEQPETVSPAGAAAEGSAAAGPGGGRSGVAWLALAVAVLSIAGLLTQRHWAPALGLAGARGPAGTVGDTAAIDELTARVGKLETASSRTAELPNRLKRAEQRLASLASGAGGSKQEAEAFAAMKTQLADTRAALATVKSQLATLEGRDGQTPPEVTEALAAVRESTAASERALAALAARVKTLEDRPAGGGEEVAALAVAAGQLEAAVDSGKPYRAALDRLKSLSDGDTAVAEAVAALDPSADKGMPTAAMLADRFAQIAPKLTAAPPAEAPAGWLTRIREKTSSLVNMRPIGKQGADSPVTRAERALARGDLAAAVTALDGVAGPVGPWRTDAAARLAADAATGAIQSRVVDLLAAAAARNGKPTTAGQGKP